MKFIVVGYLGKYSSMGQWVVDGLKSLRHEVVGIDRYSKIPVEKAVYFFVDSSEDYSANIPDIPYPKIFWSMDIHMPGGLDRAKNIASKCDLVISSNYEHGLKLFESIGISSYLVPITYKADYFDLIVPLSTRKYDVVMIGHPNSSERVQLWEILKKYNSFCGTVENLEDYRNAMINAKVVINQPTEPWDIILNNRFFEAMGCGALLLQKKLKTDLIEKLGYKQGEHFMYWNDLNDINPMLDQILVNITDYQSIADKASYLVVKDEFHNQLRKIESLILTKFYDKV